MEFANRLSFLLSSAQMANSMIEPLVVNHALPNAVLAQMLQLAQLVKFKVLCLWVPAVFPNVEMELLLVENFVMITILEVVMVVHPPALLKLDTPAVAINLQDVTPTDLSVVTIR